MVSEALPVIRSCPCGCGWQARVGYHQSWDAERAMDAVSTCKHTHAKHTLKLGIWYCDECMHWIGFQAAFKHSPTRDERERCLYQEFPDA